MHFFVSFERQDANEGRSRVYPTRPDKSFTVAQETNSCNYLGRLDHQMNASNNYSVRYPLGSPAELQPGAHQRRRRRPRRHRRHAEHREGQRLGAGRHLQPGDRRHEAEHPARCRRCTRSRSAASRSTRRRGDWTQAPPTLQYLSFIDQADDNYADYRDMNVYGLDDTFSWFIAGGRRQPRSQVRRAVSARRALPRRPALHQRAVQLRRPIAPFNAADPFDLSGAADDPRAADGAAAVADALDSGSTCRTSGRCART